MPLSPFHYQNHQLKQRSNELLYHDFLISTVISARIEQFRDSTGMPSLADDKEENPQLWRQKKKKKRESFGFFQRFSNVPRARPVIIDDPCVSASGRQERPGTSLSTNFAPETVTAHRRRH